MDENTVRVKCILCDTYAIEAQDARTLRDVIKRAGCERVGNRIICPTCLDKRLTVADVRKINQVIKDAKIMEVNHGKVNQG